MKEKRKRRSGFLLNERELRELLYMCGWTKLEPGVVESLERSVRDAIRKRAKVINTQWGVLKPRNRKMTMGCANGFWNLTRDPEIV